MVIETVTVTVETVAETVVIEITVTVETVTVMAVVEITVIVNAWMDPVCSFFSIIVSNVDSTLLDFF